MALTRPKAAIKNAEQLRSVVTNVVDLVNAELPEIRSSPDELPRHFAALALARSARLTAAMLKLRDDGMEDVSDLPLRQVAEHLSLGMYLLYGGEVAYEHLRGGYVYDLGFLDTGDGPRPKILDTWTGPRERLKWQDLMLNVVPKMVAEARSDAAAAEAFRRLYEQIYRGQTIFVAHAGVGTVSRHITIEDDGTRGIQAAGYIIDDGTGPILFAGLLTALLAVHVFDAFGRPAAAMDRLYRRLQVSAEDLDRLPDV